MNGIIFDLKRFAVHDGAGLRSTLFLKGCPLRCLWCQNPEGIAPEPALWHSPQTCVRCGGCVNACPEGALTLGERIHVDRTRCTLCGRCVDACPAAAMSVQGRSIGAQEAAELLLRDRVFFGAHGGVTLSGGEVMLQWKFAAEVLAHCRKAGVNTAVESCLLASREAMEAMLPVTDQFLVDIKFLDPALHRMHLGADNRVILENFQWLLAHGARFGTHAAHPRLYRCGGQHPRHRPLSAPERAADAVGAAEFQPPVPRKVHGAGAGLSGLRRQSDAGGDAALL